MTPGLRAERARVAQRLRDQGLTVTQVGQRMGLSRSYAHALLTDPTGAKARARKRNYGGRCERCGKRTDGSNGPAKAPKLCLACSRARQHEDAYWTAERLLAAAREWNRRYGRPPRSVRDWPRGQTIGGYRYPAASQCYVNGYAASAWVTWPRWNDYIAAAGLTPTPTGGYVRAGEVGLGARARAVLALLRDGQPRSATLIADTLGCHYQLAYRAARLLVRRGLARRDNGLYTTARNAERKAA